MADKDTKTQAKPKEKKLQDMPIGAKLNVTLVKQSYGWSVEELKCSSCKRALTVTLHHVSDDSNRAYCPQVIIAEKSD